MLIFIRDATLEGNFQTPIKFNLDFFLDSHHEAYNKHKKGSQEQQYHVNISMPYTTPLIVSHYQILSSTLTGIQINTKVTIHETYICIYITQSHRQINTRVTMHKTYICIYSNTIMRPRNRIIQSKVLVSSLQSLYTSECWSKFQ